MGKAIQDFNFFYWSLRPLVEYGARCHYNSVTIRGLENLPTHGYILAPNHQQGLMEPMAILIALKPAPVFLARADIFKQPTIRAILTFLKILPVYRIRDGKESLSKNAQIFEKSKQVILDNHPLCLMAEGRHNNRHQLLPLVKGMFRIAGDTQNALGDASLYIVPAGIDFDDYEEPYSNLCMEIGQPIPIQQFIDTFNENEPVALNQMRQTLAPEMMSLMHDIRSQAHYDEALTLCHTLNRAFRSERKIANTPWNRFQMRKIIANKFDTMEQNADSRFEQLLDLTHTYIMECRQIGITPRQESEQWNLLRYLASLLILAITIGLLTIKSVLLVSLFLLACYPMAVIPTHIVINRKVADTQFHSSFNFGVRFLLSFLYTLVFSLVMAFSTGGVWHHLLPNLPGIFWWLGTILATFGMTRLYGPVYHWLRRFAENTVTLWHRLVHREQMDYLVELRTALKKLMC